MNDLINIKDFKKNKCVCYFLLFSLHLIFPTNRLQFLEPVLFLFRSISHIHVLYLFIVYHDHI